MKKSMMKKSMKKSQMEIMGLAVIVILISVSMLFAISFIVLKEPSEYKKEYTQTELASNMLSTLLRTTVSDCKDLSSGLISIEELYQDCSRNPSSLQQVCNGAGGTKITSCGYIEETTKEIFKDTLGEWGIRYEFNARIEGETIFPEDTTITGGGGCPGVKKHKLHPVPIDPSGQKILFVTLDIC